MECERMPQIQLLKIHQAVDFVFTHHLQTCQQFILNSHQILAQWTPKTQRWGTKGVFSTQEFNTHIDFVQTNNTRCSVFFQKGRTGKGKNDKIHKYIDLVFFPITQKLLHHLSLRTSQWMGGLTMIQGNLRRNPLMGTKKTQGLKDKNLEDIPQSETTEDSLNHPSSFQLKPLRE